MHSARLHEGVLRAHGHVCALWGVAQQEKHGRRLPMRRAAGPACTSRCKVLYPLLWAPPCRQVGLSGGFVVVWLPAALWDAVVELHFVYNLDLHVLAETCTGITGWQPVYGPARVVPAWCKLPCCERV